MSMSIQNNDAILNVDPNLENDGIEWTPNDGVTITGTDYGQIQSVVIDNDTMTVTTDKGVLQFSGPAIDEAKGTFHEGNYHDTDKKLQNFNPASLMALMKAMIDLQLALSQADSAASAAQKLNAILDGIRSAAELMKGALTNLIIQSLTGALSIGMGLLSAVAAYKSLGGVGEAMEDVGINKMKTNLAETETELRETNLKIAQKQDDLDALNEQITSQDDGATPQQTQQKAALEDELTTLKTRSTELADKRTQLAEQIDDAITTADAALKKAKENVANEQEKINNGGGSQKNLDKALADQHRLQERFDKLKAIEDDFNKFEEPPNPNEIEADDADAMQAEFDKTQNWNNTGQSWAESARGDLKESWGQLNFELQHAQAKIQYWQGLTQVSQGVSQAGGAGGQYAAQQGEADSKKTDALASSEQQTGNTQAENRSKNLDSVNKFLEMWMQIIDGMHQTHRDIFA